MAPQLRIVVTGDTNCGKTTLINAIVGREVLPVSFQSETSVITYVVPQQVEDDAVPVLHAYTPGAEGVPELRPVAQGDAEVRERIRQMNRTARINPLAAADCVECRVNTQLRQSLNVFVPPASEWCDTRLMDIPGPDEVLNPAAQACADLAYALSHRLLVCVRFDQTRSRATQRLIEEIRAKAPYHFDDDLATRERCPLMFVITQVDQMPSPGAVDLEIAKQNLRAVLHASLPDCLEFAQRVPILLLSAKSSLENVYAASDGLELFDWKVFEDLLISFAGLKRDIIHETKNRRASYITALNAGNISVVADEWPYYTASLWGTRRDLAIKVGLGSALVVGTAGTAVALGVYASAASAAGAAAAQASAASAEATAAATIANSWWAWLTGFGQYGAAAAAAGGTAASAEAAAAAAAATAAVWGTGAAAAGVSTGALAGAAALSQLRPGARPPGAFSVAGMAVTHSAAVGARDVRGVLRAFSYSATASSIKAGKAYQDVLFYPDGTTNAATPEAVCALQCPFLLYNAERQGFLSCARGDVSCASARDRAEQLWWAVPAGPGKVTLQSAESLQNLRAEPSERFWDARHRVGCTMEVPAQEWRVLPGSVEGTVRFQHAETSRFLFYDGFRVGCWSEQFPDQDWLVVPKVPLYIGEFMHSSMYGQGQFFWTCGAPLFKGEVHGGELVRGFVFDERSVCHGYFAFAEGRQAQLEGVQPEDADASGGCAACGADECLAAMGRAFKPCGHGVVCEACARKSRECPYCRSPVEGLMRTT